MAVVIPNPIGGLAWRFTLEFTAGGYGWTESYRWNNAQGLPQQAIYAAQALAINRTLYLPSNINLSAIRIVSLSGYPTQLLEGPTFAAMPGQIGGTNDSPPWWSALITIVDPSATYRKQFRWRGLANSMLDLSNTATAPALSATGQQYIRSFLAFLTGRSSTGVPTAFAPTWTFQAGTKNKTLNGFIAVTGGTQDAQGCTLTLNMASPPAFPFPGRVILSGIKTNQQASFSGPAKILGQAGSVLSVYHKSCCCGGGTILPGGGVHLAPLTSYAIGGGNYLREVSRKVGRGFLGTRGRGKKCSC